jgi:hypothetical protein
MEPEGSLPSVQDHPPVTILSHINPDHTTPSYLSKIHFNIIHLVDIHFLVAPCFLACHSKTYMHGCSIPGHYKKKVVGLERGPLSLMSTIEELLDRKVAAPV